MSTLARAATAATAVLLASVVLAGCSDDAADDGAEARTAACRTYALGAGADGERLADELAAVVEQQPEAGYNAEDSTKRLRAVRLAAGRSGSVADLPTADYRLFRAVVTTSLALDTAVNDSEAGSLDAAAVNAYVKAVKALGAVCD